MSGATPRKAGKKTTTTSVGLSRKDGNGPAKKSTKVSKPGKQTKKKVKAKAKAKAKGKKKKKDPNRPKGPMTPFVIYSMQMRMILKKKHPTWDFGKLSVATGKNWSQLTDEDKIPFNKLATKDRSRFVREMKKYVPPAESSSSESSDDTSSDEESSEEDIEDENASSSEEEEQQEYVAVRRRGSKRSRAAMEDDGPRGPGPPYTRVEYYSNVTEEPEISPVLAQYVPNLSTSILHHILHHRLRAKGRLEAEARNKRSGRVGSSKKRNKKSSRPQRQRTLQWDAVERSASSVVDTMTNNLNVTPASMAPLPGFAKHVLLAQGRRALACYVSTLSVIPATPATLATLATLATPVSSGKDSVMWGNRNTLQVGHDALSVNEIEKMKDVLNDPINIGTCDMLSLPNFEELMNVPVQLMESCLMDDKELLGPSALDHQQMPISIKCIYVRLNKRGGSGSGSSSGSGSDSEREREGGGKTTEPPLYDYCLLHKTTPWLKFTSEVLALLWEVKYVARR
jgi:hypothetical protein